MTRAKPRRPVRNRLSPMKVSDAFKSFVLDQLEELGDVTPRSMFGGVGLYRRGIFFGIIAADVLYLKVDATNRPDYERAGMHAFKPYPDRARYERLRRRVTSAPASPAASKAKVAGSGTEGARTLSTSE